LSDASDAFRHALATQAFSQDTGALLGSGELTIADNHVDPSTGTVQMKARFPNGDRKLWPGQFVNVRLTLQVLHDALIIPAAAVMRGPQQTFVYLAGPDSKAVVRNITVASEQESNAIISSGLAAGDSVVTDGQMSLRPGIALNVRTPAAKPVAADSSATLLLPAATGTRP